MLIGKGQAWKEGNDCACTGKLHEKASSALQVNLCVSDDSVQGLQQAGKERKQTRVLQGLKALPIRAPSLDSVVFTG